MTRRLSARSLVAVSTIAILSACVVNLSFDMKKQFQLKSPDGSPNSISQSQLVDLSQYKEIADHKASIKSLDLDYAEVTVTAINAGNQAHKVISGSLKLRQNLTDLDHDIPVGALTNFPIALNSSTRLNGTPTLDAFLFQMLQTQSKFYAIIEGQIDGAADVAIEVNMHASIGYDAGVL